METKEINGVIYRVKTFKLPVVDSGDYDEYKGDLNLQEVIEMDSKQKAVLIKITEDVEYLLGEYGDALGTDEAYQYGAVMINALHLLEAFTDNKDALEAKDLLFSCIELIETMVERDEWCFDTEHLTKAIKPCKLVVEQVERLESKLEHTPTRYREMGTSSCLEEALRL